MKSFQIVFLCCVWASTTHQSCLRTKKPPNIVVIVADDVGYNDIGFHGSNQIPTPNIDALAYNGIILGKFYTQNACTPSRAAFLTGNYPLRSGLQGKPIMSGENKAIPQDMPIMPEHLKKLGYKTHLVGKWHLGSAYRNNTPTERGFDTHFGYWNGYLGYFDYRSAFNGSSIEGYDLHDDFETDWTDNNKYATSVFTNRALDVIDEHDQDDPLFLMVTHLAAHAGAGGVELGVPNATLANLKYHYINSPRRRLYSEVVSLMDASVGRIVKRLADRRLLENSVIFFWSDNGAPTIGQYANTGSNWPLRGIKMTNFEGAIRGTGAIYSPLLRRSGYINRELIHISDFLPTLYSIAGGDLDDLGDIDGINQWDTLSANLPTTRTEILVNINEIEGTSAMIMNKGRYKLINGTYELGVYDRFYGDSGRSLNVPPYDMAAVLNSDVNTAIRDITERRISPVQVTYTRAHLDLSWCRNSKPYVDCSGPCLFDLELDPCETTNIIAYRPEIALRLLERIEEYNLLLVPQGSEGVVDPRSNPSYYNNTWCTWLDDEWCPKTPSLIRTI